VQAGREPPAFTTNFI
jgi:hypothetical protein